MKIAPEAELDDGQFDIVAVGDLGTFEAARHFRKLYKGTHIALEKVVHRRAKRVDAEPVDAKDDVLLDVDGEQLGTLPATFTLLPRALQIMVPA
jgi:diacylglycerol kinase family enzyme